MKFSYNWLKKYVDIKLSPEKSAELLTLHSFETSADRNGMLDIDVLPNRTHDCFSHYGIAEEIAILTKKRVKELKTGYKETGEKTADFISVEIKEKNLCSRYMARVLTNVKIAPSPKWLQDILAEFNVKSHNNIVDILNYIMLEMGQPMHAFDYEKLQGRKIIVRRAKKGEKINTLDGGKYDLNGDTLVIADSRKPIAIAGIKGGFETGVSSKTKRVVLESANFEPVGIRHTSRTLGLNTDAAVRFSAGLDPNLAQFGLNRACSLLQEIAGAKIAEGSIDVYPKKFVSRIIKLNLDYLNRLIGVNIKPQFVKTTLESLGALVKASGKSSFLVTVPTSRLDLEREEDLIEEVSRLYGYNNLKSILPIGTLGVPKRNDVNYIVNKTRDILTSSGFNEVYNYSFIGNKDITKEDKKELIELENPTSEEFKYLRSGLIFNLFKNVKNNFRFFGNVKFFEIGKVFNKGKKADETLGLGGIYAVKENKESQPGSIFFEIKGNLDVLFDGLGIADSWYDPDISHLEKKWWHDGRVALVKFDDEIIGIIGEINPAVLEILGIKGRVAAFNLDVEKIAKIAAEEREFSPIPKYPAVIRDIAILTVRDIRMSEVLDVIYQAGADLIEDVDLFDFYEGEEIPEGKKNLAFHIVFQADHTLTDEEIRREEEKIKNALIKELDAEIR